MVESFSGLPSPALAGSSLIPAHASINVGFFIRMQRGGQGWLSRPGWRPPTSQSDPIAALATECCRMTSARRPSWCPGTKSHAEVGTASWHSHAISKMVIECITALQAN